MAVRKDLYIPLPNGGSLDTRAELYNCAEDVVTDCKHRSVRISDYELGSLDKSWCGVESYDEALSLLKTGYQSTVDEFRKELSVEPSDGTRFSFKNNIQGFAPIVPLALKCVPNSMVCMDMKPIKAKVLDIYYDMTVLAGTSPDEIIKAGQAILGAIIDLEKQGYRFNLYAVQTYCRGDKNDTVDILCVKVKSSSKPLDLKRMSFPLTHPAFFRVIGFDWQGKSPITRDVGWGRGRDFCKEHSDYSQLMITKLFGSNAHYLSGSQVIRSKYDREKLKESFKNGYTKKEPA